jgi:hypothetical protein
MPDNYSIGGTLVLSEREPSRSEQGVLVRALGVENSFETKHLHEYCYAEPSELSHDIASLLGAVKLSDRSFPRHHSRAWGRSLKVELPVYELELWRRQTVGESLQECLQYLTGDRWEFSFVKRRRKAAAKGQVHLLSAPDVPRIFVPFSHGLDSFAQSELLASRERPLEIVPVNINSNRSSGTWKSLGQRDRARAISVSSRVDEPHRTEPSFRTRPFIYDLMAAYGAAMSDAHRVLVPENGQGSLGGSLVPLGMEAPHRSCHPGFTSRLGRFLFALTGRKVRFEHRALFLTKGQVLASLVKIRPNSSQWLAKHPSCSYDARHAHDGGRKVHCGVCGNCLLRRLSAHAAGIVDSTPYRVADIHAPTIESTFGDRELPREFSAYRDVARNSARSMQRLAELALEPDAPRVWAEIEGIARYQERSIPEIKEDMFALLRQHRAEWTEFLRHCGESSWVYRLAEG